MFEDSKKPLVGYEISALNNFAKFTGKHLCWSLFLNKVACNFIKNGTAAQVLYC